MSREAKALLSDVDTSRGTSPVTTTHAVGARVEARYRATVLGKMGTKWFAASVRAVHGDGSYDVLYDDGDEENGVLAQFVRAPKLKATAPQAPKKPKAAAAPKQLSAAERERLERRNVISRARDAAKYARAGFLQPHRAVLERFGANVPSAAAAAGAPAFRIDPAVGQPAEVGVPLRDYQLDGLRWLVAMHTSVTSNRGDGGGSGLSGGA